MGLGGLVAYWGVVFKLSKSVHPESSCEVDVDRLIDRFLTWVLAFFSPLGWVSAWFSRTGSGEHSMAELARSSIGII